MKTASIRQVSAIAFCAIVLWALPLPVWAADSLPAPICARPTVLMQVSEILERAGRSFTLETGSVGQAPTADAGVVECAVRVHTLVFDITLMGRAPLDQVTVFSYALRLQANGVFLHPWGERPL
jgi:hypothetical protein